jgi:hypothetical protein
MVAKLETTLKKLTLLSALTVLLCVGIVYAVSDGFRPRSSPQVLTVKDVNEQAGLELTMSLEKAEYSVGEPINMTFTLTNISNHTLEVRTGDVADFDFQVYNDKNYSLYRDSSSRVLLPFFAFIRVGAGENLTDVLVWDQTCNITRAHLNGVPASAGTYDIVGEWDCAPGLETTPIQVTIVKP